MKPKLTTLLSFMLITLSGYSQSLKDSLQANGYLFDQFKNGTVLLKSGVTQSAPLNYNTKDQSFAFSQNGEYLTVTNPEQIDTVYVDDKKFIALNGKFYELAVKNKVSLLVTYVEDKHPLMATSDHNGSSLQNTNQVSNTVTGAYVTQKYKGNFNVYLKKQYWLVKENNLYKANTEKQVISRFPAKSSLISQYITENKIRIDEEKDMIKLVNYCNNL